MAKRQKKAGGRKEAPLAVVGSSASDVVHQSPQEQVFTSKDAEYQHFSELLRGFFEKLTRWQEILAAEQYRETNESSWFEVFIAASGLSIRTPKYSVDETKDSIVTIRSVQSIYTHDPEHGKFSSIFQIMPGLAGRPLLVDPEGKALEELNIRVSDDRNTASKSLIIDARYPGATTNIPERHTVVSYRLNRQTLTIERRPSFEEGLNMPEYYEYKLMPETHQIHIFKAIDALIPGASTATPQPKRRATNELGSLKKLPAPGRRRARK